MNLITLVVIHHECIHRQETCITMGLVGDNWDMSLTFWPFQQVDLQNCLGWGLPSSDQQPHHWTRLLQGFYRSAVNHLRHVHIVHTQHTVIHPVEGKVLT